MSLAIVGTGLVSPWARSPEEHAFFLRADTPGPARSPYLHGEDEVLKVRVAPWLGTAVPLRERLLDLARTALDEALRPLRELSAPLPSSLFVCTSAARSPDAPDVIEEAFAAHGRPPRAERVGEDAGVFSALERAARLVREDESRAVAIVAVDSFVSLDALCAWVRAAPSPWAKKVPPLSEGAAAIVVTSAARARDVRLRALGSVAHTAVAADPANDHNDDPATAAALTGLVRQLPSSRPIRFTFGPMFVGALRSAEWHRATARNASRFEPTCEMRSIEAEVGRCGAAAGAMDLVWGLAALRADAMRAPAEPKQPFLAWAISPDGLRGVASVIAEEPR